MEKILILSVLFHMATAEMVAYSDEKTFDDAFAFCAGRGQRLARIDDADDNDAALQAITDNGADISFWIDAKTTDGDQLETNNGIELTYSNFASGEPTGNGPCIQLWKDRSYDFDDVGCDSNRGFICETIPSPIFHVEGCDGRYTLTYEDARSECEKYRTEIATYADLEEAWNVGFQKCRAGWLDGARVAYPMQVARENCGKGTVGIVEYNNVDESETYDVYCKTHGY